MSLHIHTDALTKRREKNNGLLKAFTWSGDDRERGKSEKASRPQHINKDLRGRAGINFFFQTEEDQPMWFNYGLPAP